MTFWRLRSAPALPERRLWRLQAFAGPSTAPRHSRHPGSGGHEAWSRPAALARRAAANMSRGPEEVNRLTEITYRVSGFGWLEDSGAPGLGEIRET